MLNKIIKLFWPRWYECTPYNYDDGPGLRVKVRAWTRNSARMKVHDYLKAENIIVREL